MRALSRNRRLSNEITSVLLHVHCARLLFYIFTTEADLPHSNLAIYTMRTSAEHRASM